MSSNAATASALTQRQVDALRPGRTQYVRWDRQTPGFGVRVSPGGAKTYVLFYRTAHGRQRWLSLGRTDAMSLVDARRLATSARGDVAKRVDPQSDRDRAKGAVTVAEAARRFLAEHAQPRLAKSTLRNYQLAIRRYIDPTLGRIPIDELAMPDVVRLHQRISAPYQANRVVSCLSTLCSWATKAGLRAVAPNPCQGVEFRDEENRKRYLSDVEYARVGAELRRGRRAGCYPVKALAAIELAMYTGCRPAEIASLTWDSVDEANRAIHLRTSKTGPRTIYLSPEAVAVVRRCPRFKGDAHVFPGRPRRQADGARLVPMHPSTMTHVWQDVRAAAKVPDVRLYDACRHSFASMALSKLGMSLAQIGEQLGHSQPATTKRYAHLHDKVKRENASRIGGSIAAALGRRTRGEAR